MRINRRLALFLTGVVLVIGLVHLAGDLHYDFGVFYYAAHMALEGRGGSLYDLASQQMFQVRYGRPQEFIFCSPPFVLLFFLPTAVFSIPVAFLFWTIASVALLTFTIQLLCKRLNMQFGQWPFLLTIAFMPVTVTLSHGQLSIVVLAAYVFCYLLWHNNRPLLGGMVLALALVKFQLVAGFICVLLLKRKWREIAGFVLGSIPCLSLSVCITGWKGLLRYPALLAAEEGSPGVDPNRMASLRGLITTLTGHRDYVIIVVTLSIMTLLLAAAAWKDLDTGFCSAVLASMLTSYHFNPQDLTLLVIPLLLISARLSSKSALVVAAFAYTLPLVFWFAADFSLMAILLVCMLVVLYMRPGLAFPRFAETCSSSNF